MRITLCAFADEAASDFDGQIKALKENNIPLIEIRKLDGKNIFAFSKQDAEKYRDAFKENGIGVWSLGSPLGKTRESVDMGEYIKKTESLCQTAEILNCQNIRAFSFYPKFFSFHKDIVFEKLSTLVDCVNAHGLNYCHENEKGIYGSTLERVEELLKALPDMKLVYDPANFLQCSQNAEKTLNALAKKAHYFHVKDAVGKQVVPAGFGEGKLSELVSMIDRDCVLSVEPHLQLFRGSKTFNQSELSGKFNLKTSRGRFDCAVAATKKLLIENGFKDCGTYFEKL